MRHLDLGKEYVFYVTATDKLGNTRTSDAVSAYIGDPLLCVVFDAPSMSPSHVPRSYEIANGMDSDLWTGRIRTFKDADMNEIADLFSRNMLGLPHTALTFDDSLASFVAWYDDFDGDHGARFFGENPFLALLGGDGVITARNYSALETGTDSGESHHDHGHEGADAHGGDEEVHSGGGRRRLASEPETHNDEEHEEVHHDNDHKEEVHHDTEHEEEAHHDDEHEEEVHHDDEHEEEVHYDYEHEEEEHEQREHDQQQDVAYCILEPKCRSCSCL